MFQDVHYYLVLAGEHSTVMKVHLLVELQMTMEWTVHGLVHSDLVQIVPF